MFLCCHVGLPFHVHYVYFSMFMHMYMQFVHLHVKFHVLFSAHNHVYAHDRFHVHVHAHDRFHVTSM
jgi:hypothetical protein